MSTTIVTLEQKIAELEKRIVLLEEQVNTSNDPGERAWMDQLYKKAEELVVKHQKASAIFLQRKLYIDLPRAQSIIRKLESKGVIGTLAGEQTRSIRAKR